MDKHVPFIFGALVCSCSVSADVTFQPIPVHPGGAEYRLGSIGVLGNGGFYLEGQRLTNPSRVEALKLENFEVAVGSNDKGWSGLAGSNLVGTVKPSPVNAIVYMTEGNSDTGTGYVVGFNQFGGGHFSRYAVTDNDGPVLPKRNAISYSLAGDLGFLFEVVPVNLGSPHKILVITRAANQEFVVHRYILPVGETVVDCAPRSEGGFAVLTGSSLSGSLRYIDASGAQVGPFVVGAASRVAYSKVNGGTVFTGGSASSGNMVFTRSPFGSGPTQTSTIPFPFGSSSVNLTCVDADAGGMCWWGGEYQTTLGDENGFILATDVNLVTSGENIAGNTSGNEHVNSITFGPTGLGAWAGIGSAALFDTSDGLSLATYPAVPDLNLSFDEVKVSPHRSSGIYVEPFTRFCAIGVYQTDQHSQALVISAPGVLYKAESAVLSCVGGTSPTIYGFLFQGDSVAHTFNVESSTSNVTTPATVTFPNRVENHLAQFSVITKPVATQEDVEIRIGTGRKVVARFTLLPPTPYFFTPASQGLTGGQNGTCRLSLNGKAPVGGLPVALSSSGPEVTVPNQLLVPSGLYSRSFLFSTAPVTAPITRTIQALYAGISRTTAITVRP